MSSLEGEQQRADVVRNRSAILDAATEVLAEDPAASLAQIAQRAGLGRATLYRHFASREALGVAIREEALARAAAVLSEAELDRGTARDAVRRLAERLLPLGLRFRVILVEGVDMDPDFIQRRDAVLRPLLDVVARGQRAGELAADVPPAWVMSAVTALMVTAARAVSTDTVPAEVAAELVCRTAFDGLAAG